MKHLFYFLFTLLLFLTGCEKDKVKPLVDDISSVRGYKNWYIGNFRCGLFVPPSYDSNKSYPLIIRLHGYTDTTTWNLTWYQEPVLSSDPCIVLTPRCPKEDPYGWGDSFDPRTSPMMAKTYEMLDMVKKSFNLNYDRFYIYGSSMGGRGVYGAIKKNPDMFAAAYVECGNVNVEIAPIISKIPIWIFHGSDDQVVPVQPARNLYKAVLDLGGTQIRYTEYKGVGHNVWDYTSNETTLTTWFLAQRKGIVHGEPASINNFTGEVSSGNRVTLHWSVPVESEQEPDNRIWYCRIYRNGEVIQEVYNIKNSFTDSTRTLNHSYEYTITAINYYFRESEVSQSLFFASRR